MYYKIVLILVVIFSLQATSFAQVEQKNDTQMMIGKIKLKDFKVAPFKTWFDEEYNSYKPDYKTLSEITKIDKKIKVLVFFGSWCGDSRREVPRFLKIAEHLKIKKKKISYMGLDRKKTAPVYKENIWDIQYVPTFIFLKEGKEIGRIIETPNESLEKDLKKILNGGL
jgi:thiol-disulfide isomerase/thioredoxin